LEIEPFLIKTKVYFRLLEEPCVEVRSAGNDNGAFSLGMQAERNFDCGRELSLQENAVIASMTVTISFTRVIGNFARRECSRTCSSLSPR